MVIRHIYPNKISDFILKYQIAYVYSNKINFDDKDRNP